MYKVLIIQAEVKHYRVPFYTALHAELRRDQIVLTVAYSNSNPVDALQGDSAELPPPIGKRVSGHWFFGRLFYQHVWNEIFQSDLVVVQSELKCLINPILLLMSRMGLKTVAFWGLGPNKRPNRSPLAETIKRQFVTWADWWFAYTTLTAGYLKNQGMPPDRITNVQNASDSRELRRLIHEISEEEISKAKLALTRSTESRIGFYCGVMAEIKALPLLLETARLVKQGCPDFHLVLIGNGVVRPWLERAIADTPWIHYLGSKYGRESALYYKMADVFLLAGTAGLAVVDCFAAGLPILATELNTHPPEISYVVSGQNGYLAPHEAQAFANSVIKVLSDPILRDKLRAGARDAGAIYTIEAMVQNFRSGIKKCLARYSPASDTVTAGHPISGPHSSKATSK
jgi:L-malate glycosyltransferase